MKRGLVVIVLTAILMMAGTAVADSMTMFTQGSFTATVSIVGNTATLTFGGLNGYYTDQVAIHIANGATVNSGSATSGNWNFGSGQNSVNCGGTGNWFCAVAASNTLFNNLSVSWNFSGTLIDPISVQFAVCNSSTPGCAPGSSNFVTNFSQSSAVPEPASMGFLAAGLLGVGFTRRRK